MPETKPKPAPPTDTAPDVIAAAALCVDLAALNAPMLRKTELNENDHETIGRIRQAAEVFVSEAQEGQVIRAEGEKPISAKRIATMIGEYLALLTATRTEHVGDLVLESDVPAIESSAVRRHVEKLGEHILALLRTLVEQRRRRETQIAERRAADVEEIARLRKDDPIAGPLLDIYERLMVSIFSNAPTTSRDHIVAARTREAIAGMLTAQRAAQIIALLDEEAKRHAPKAPKKPAPRPIRGEGGAKFVSAPDYLSEARDGVKLSGVSR